MARVHVDPLSDRTATITAQIALWQRGDISADMLALMVQCTNAEWDLFWPFITTRLPESSVATRVRNALLIAGRTHS